MDDVGIGGTDVGVEDRRDVVNELEPDVVEVFAPDELGSLEEGGGVPTTTVDVAVSED